MTSVNLASTTFVKNLRSRGLIIMTAGALIAIISAVLDFERFMSTYILGFWYFAGISITMVFFSALQFLTRSGWSASIRRIPENLAGMVPFLLIGMLPIIINLFMEHPVYHWVHEAHTDPVVMKKAGYLNETFFVVRLVLYALLWFSMARYVIGNSRKQDEVGSSDLAPTRRNWKRAAPWVLAYALTITFCSFDLLMSLEAHWFSTIWGVYSFAGHFVAALSIIALVVISLRKHGLLKEYLTDEHMHDLGKLMFAFTVFWAYISFSQYFIIWYANLPEETYYYTNRMAGGWEIFGFLLIITRFVIPFFLLLRQDVKRRSFVMKIAAYVILASHFIDLVWIIMPVGRPELTFGWQEFGPWLFFLGVFLVMASIQFSKGNSVAVHDPLIKESVEYSS